MRDGHAEPHPHRAAPAAERREPGGRGPGHEELRPLEPGGGGAGVVGRSAPRRGGRPGARRRPGAGGPAGAARQRSARPALGPRRPAGGAGPGRLDLRHHLPGRRGAAAARPEAARPGAVAPERLGRGGDRVRGGAAGPLRRGADPVPGGVHHPHAPGLRLDEPGPGGGGGLLRHRAGRARGGAARRGAGRGAGAARHRGGALGPGAGGARAGGLPQPAEPGAHPGRPAAAAGAGGSHPARDSSCWRPRCARSTGC